MRMSFPVRPAEPALMRVASSLGFLRSFAWLCVTTLVLAPTPAAAAMGPDDARHLVARTGFGVTAAEMDRFAKLDRAQAVDALLATAHPQPDIAPPRFEDHASVPAPGRSLTPEERREFVRDQNQQTQALRGWWVEQMLATTSPLTERMTLFWHNHFVSSQQKVRLARLMYLQNATFRANALGSFRTLLHAAAREPAMVVYLDSVRNRKGAPNENFAREVMELFTLGEGRYTEQDVKEAARAFTGWSIERPSGAFVDRPRLHDDADKTVFGHRGRYDGDDVLDLILARPETARFIVGKLWREFVSPDPDAAAVTRIAADFQRADYDLKVALRALLLEPAFWAAEHRGTLVKSPVELVVGTLHTLGVQPDNAAAFATASAGMSQVLFAPPNVKGWPGGDTWINSTTLLARKQFLAAIAHPAMAPSDDVQATAMIGVAATPMGDAAMPPARDGARMPGIVAGSDAPVVDAALQRARAARVVERALARLQFGPAAWIGAQPGADLPARLATAQRVLLPLPPVTDDVAEARAQRDAVLFVRAALLDPVYELK